MIGRLWARLTPCRRRQFFLLLGLMMVASVAEVITIGSVIPFLGVLTLPDRTFSYPLVRKLSEYLGGKDPNEMLVVFTLVFCVAAVISGVIRLVLLYSTNKYSYNLGADLAREAYFRTLHQPYLSHVSNNSSDVVNGIVYKTTILVSNIIMPLMNLIGSVLILAAISTTLLILDAVVVSISGLIFSLVYVAIYRLTRERLRKNSDSVASQSTRALKALQEGLGGIRDVLITGSQDVYVEAYTRADRSQRASQGLNNFIAGSPRFIIETLGTVMIASLAFAVSQRPGGVADAIPLLGALALGAQRVLPLLQQAFSNLASIRGAQGSMRDALAILEQEIPQGADPYPASLPLRTAIELKDLGFRYAEESPWAIHGINLEIPKGARVGIMGASGSGKSTLVDVIMGLLTPTVGSLRIDGIEVSPSVAEMWKKHIAHVPQSIYLADTSVLENIAFAVPKENIDLKRVMAAATQAHIAGVIEGWPQKYETTIGERGARLSGGQRQRIAIARALYRNADVIVFDEATSALDGETERAVIDSIRGLGRSLTIIIVAHRLSTLKYCDIVVEMRNGQVAQVGPYSEIVCAKPNEL